MAAAHSTRVAVVQLAYHPATIIGGRSPLCDPLHDPEARTWSLEPREGSGPLSSDLLAEIRALGERVRSVHGEQLLGKALAILGACAGWGVEVVVFPEYSLAWELLPRIAAAAGEMVVVAGSHAVEEGALAAGVYAALGCPKGQVPRIDDEVVSPVLWRGRIVALRREAPIAGVPGAIAAALERPIARAYPARVGGSTIVGGDPSDGELPFPAGPGALPAGDEGVIVADVEVRPGATAVAIEPFACASLVYRTHPHGDAYAAWIETLHEAITELPTEDHAALFEVLGSVDERRQFLLDAGGLRGAKSRGWRYEALLGRLEAIQSGGELARFTREVIVPVTILPFEHVREAMALGAVDALHRWWQASMADGEAKDTALMEVLRRLKAGGEPMWMPPPSMWTEAGRAAVSAIKAAIAEGPAVRHPAARTTAPPRAAARRWAAVEHDGDDPHALLESIRPRLLGALAQRRARKLADVDDHYEPPDVVVDGDAATTSALAALDAWLADETPRALLLGDFGAGKSTLLTVWAERRWRERGGRRPVLVPLRETHLGDPIDLVQRALAAADAAIPRAELAHLIECRAVVPCFDGVDEVPAGDDATGEGLAGWLSAGVGAAAKVLFTARDQHGLEDRLTQALTGARRLVLSPLSELQIARLIAATRQSDGDAQRIAQRLAAAYDLAELVRRPLILGMVLRSLEALDPSARIGAADVYNAYLTRWLAEVFGEGAERVRELAIVAAEELADELWRSGQPSCAIRQVSARLLAAAGEVEAGELARAVAGLSRGFFFVRVGDRLRFAHLSFLEFFLARGLVRTLSVDVAARLATRPLTTDVMVFVAQLLRRDFGDPLASPPVQAIRRWLVAGATTAARALLLADPRTNALRLLLQLPTVGAKESDAPHDSRQWVPEGAPLTDVDLRGEDLRHARLRHVDLSRADLRGADLRHADLRGSTLDAARLDGADLRGADLRGSTLADRRDGEDDADAIGDVDAASAAITAGGAISPIARAPAETAARWRELEAESSRGFDAFAELDASIAGDDPAAPIEAAEEQAEALAEAASELDDDEAPRQSDELAPPSDGPLAPSSARPPPALAAPPSPAPVAAPASALPGGDLRPVPKASSNARARTDDDADDPGAGKKFESLLRKLAPSTSPDPRRRLHDKLAERAQALAPNPFLPGRPLRDAPTLPGREDILAELTTLIHQRSPALLKGPRRAGKSSILYTLARSEGGRRRVYHRTLEGKAPRDPAEFAALVDPDLRGRKDPADALITALEAAPAPPVILLDEVAWLTRADEALFPWLRVLGQEGLCAIVVAGSHSDWLAVIRQANRTPGSSFGNDYTIVELEALGEADAIAFLVDTAPEDVTIDPDRGARWIVELCGGWPFYLQVMGYAVVEEARQGKRGPLVDRGALFDLYERRLLRDRVAVFSSRWADLRPPAQEVLLAVLDRAARSKAGRALTPYRDLGRRERAILSDAGVIDGQRGWLLDPPLRDWLIRNFDELEVSDGEAL